MFDLFSNPSEMHPRSAREVNLRVRKMEKQQVQMAAEISADVSPRKTRKMGLLGMIIHLFGGPTLF